MSQVTRTKHRGYLPVTTEPMTGRYTFLQQPPLILVRFWIRDRIWAAETNVGERRYNGECTEHTSIQTDFPGYSADMGVHNPYSEAELVLVRAPSVGESARPSVEVLMPGGE